MTDSNANRTTSTCSGMDELLQSLPPMDSATLRESLLKASEIDSSFDADQFRKRYEQETLEVLVGSAPGNTVAADAVQHLQTKLQKYQERYASKNHVTARFAVSGQPQQPIVSIRTHVVYADTGGWNVGKWSGHYTFVLLDDEKTATLSGQLVVHVHSAETANVQTRFSPLLDETTLSTAQEKVHERVAALEQQGDRVHYEEQLCTLAVQCIANFEQAQVYDPIMEFMACENLSSSLRQLRPILPLTKTRFQWDSAAQKNVQWLNASTQKNNKSAK